MQACSADCRQEHNNNSKAVAVDFSDSQIIIIQELEVLDFLETRIWEESEEERRFSRTIIITIIIPIIMHSPASAASEEEV